jgi:murein DD-endopeptidase MepM/ murein hydrolase activator NlpD
MNGTPTEPETTNKKQETILFCSMKFLLSTILFLSYAASAQEDHSIEDLKAGRFKQDSSYVYALPYEKGHSYLLIQAYQSKMSHKGEYALDFKMKEGTRVCAARKGVVVSAREDSQKGGLKPEMLSEGNYIIIKHEDGTQAHYWHFQYNGVLVNEGDTVNQGQVIGLSGNTGYCAFPHLHFEVNEPGKGQVPTRFNTRKGVKYLRPGKWHKRG